jgi:hypothetical protein
MNPFAAVIAKKKAGGGGGGGGPIFASDTFTGSDGTDLTSHTGEVGATWAKVTGITGVFKITSNKAKGDSAGLSLYYASGTPDTNEYDIEADMHQVSSTDLPGVGGRIDQAADSGYYLYFDSGNWVLAKRVSGTDTSLGTYTDALVNGNDRHIKLQIRTAAKKAFIDGVERISSADDAVTGVGKAGIRTANSDWGLGSTGRTLDTFVATNA